MTTLCCRKETQAVYRPRRPEQTPLFQLVKKHYVTWHKNKTHENEVPRYISNAFQKYLGCGILAKGFACAHCEECKQDFFIAFSCKGRGICPSCASRAMVETAAHLVTNVLPRVPFRQFVISFPMRIRHYLENHNTLQTELFYETALTQDDITDTQESIQKRVLAYFCRRKFFEPFAKLGAGDFWRFCQSFRFFVNPLL